MGHGKTMSQRKNNMKNKSNTKEISMKKVLIASVLAVGLASGVAFAHNNGYGSGGGYGGHMMGGYGGYGMMGPGMMNGYGYGGDYDDCPGAAALGNNGWNSQSQQKFLDETVGLRKELNDKSFDYAEAMRNPNTTREQLATLQKEMIDIRTKLQDKAEQYR